MFSQGDKIVYPGHGVAEISRVVEKQFDGKTSKFFELRFVSRDVVILVPVGNAQEIGLRPLSTEEGIRGVLDILCQKIEPARPDTVVSNWNKRNREYQGKIRSGDLREIGEIYRDLQHISCHKELSFGEKNLLDQTELLLAEEISIVNDMVPERAKQKLRTLVGRV